MPTLIAAVGLLAAPSAGLTQETPWHPEVWMCYGKPLELIDPDAEWNFVRENLDCLQLYVDWVNKCPADGLAELARVLDENDIKVAIECGGTLGFAPLNDTNGQASARIELGKMRKLIDAGGQIDYLNMDGPVRRLLHPPGDRQGFTSIDRCVSELIDYMFRVREVHPDITFFALTNFPNWGYRGDVSYHARGPERQDWGDYSPVIETVIRKTKEVGLEINGLTIDNPYEYIMGQHFSVKLDDPTDVDWVARVVDLQETVRGEGLTCNLIVNSEEGGKESGEAFAATTLEYLDLIERSELTPDRIIIQSWYEHPTRATPETDPTTMTGLVKQVIERVKPR